MPTCSKCDAPISVLDHRCRHCGISFGPSAVTQNPHSVILERLEKAKAANVMAQTPPHDPVSFIREQAFEKPQRVHAEEVDRAAGWVYVMCNKAMPSLVKVGFTTNTPDQRAKELEGTGIPHKFSVEYAALVIDPQWVEGRAHKHLEEHHEGKEWFRCGVEGAVIAIRDSAEKILREDCRRVDRQLIAQEQLRRKREADQQAAQETRRREISEHAESQVRKLRDEFHLTKSDIAKMTEEKIARGRQIALEEWDRNANSFWKVVPFVLPIAVLSPINIGLGIVYAVIVLIVFSVSFPIRKRMALSSYEESDEAKSIRSQGRLWIDRSEAKLESQIKEMESNQSHLLSENRSR